MSMLKICGQELELDLFDADTMEVYEKSLDKVVERSKEAKKHTELSNAEGIRETCGIVKDFFDEIFGEGTSEKLFKGKDNLLVCMDAFGIVSSEANSAGSEAGRRRPGSVIGSHLRSANNNRKHQWRR